MPTSEAYMSEELTQPDATVDPQLRAQIQSILHQSGVTQRADVPAEIRPVRNSFQDKGNVYKVTLDSGPALLLKLEHPFFASHLDREARLLDFFATTSMPVPRMIAHGTCTLFQVGSVFPYYILMEYLAGIPLNWVYYRAERAERRDYLRQIVQHVGHLASFRVRHANTTALLGSIGGPLQHDGSFVACSQLMPFPNEPIGPFESIRSMFEAQIGFWLEQLQTQPDDRYSADLAEAWARLDRAVLTSEVPVAVAHGDIAPMNMMVDPDTRQITGLIDWEFAGFYPADMDFHSLLYYDRYQSWKWTGAEDVQMARELMREQQIEPPEGYDERLPWFDLLQLAKDACQFREWFANAPDELVTYQHALDKRITMLLHGT